LSRILILRLSSLGDIVQALPLAGTLEEAGHQVSWLLEDRFAGLGPLLRAGVLPMIWKRGWRGAWKLRGQGQNRFDLALDLQGNFKSAFLGRILGLKPIFGFARNELRESLAGMFRQERLPPSSSLHMAERGWELACFALGKTLPPLSPPPHLVPTPEMEKRLRAILVEKGISPSAPLYVLVAGALEDPRVWPLSQVLSLFSRLENPSLVLLGPREDALVLPPWVPCLRQRGSRGLEDLVALGAHLRKTGGKAIGHDGGAMHVLHATGASTLFLFGPQDPRRTGPRGGDVLVSKDDLPCRPCLKRQCALESGPICMEGITVEQVLAFLGAPRSFPKKKDSKEGVE